MKPFNVRIFQRTGDDLIQGVVGFVGEDATGSFGILAGHTRFMTVLEMGLARIKFSDGRTEYLALSGGILSFSQNELVLHTRHYWKGSDYLGMTQVLQTHLKDETEKLRRIKSSLTRIEESMARRLMELERQS